MIQTIFTILIIVQFLVIALHDWLDIPGWTHGRQVRAALGVHKMLMGTLINCIFPGLAAVYALRHWNEPIPHYVLNYWVIYCAISMFGAITSWWIPYFRGTDEKTKELYRNMYAGTWQVLPPRGDNPCPNVLHLFFHALCLITLMLAIIMRLGIA